MGTLIKSKYIRNLNDYGWRIATQKSLNFIIKPIYQKIIYYLYELDLNKKFDHRSDPKDEKYIYKMLVSKDTEAIYQIEEMEEWLKGTNFSKQLEGNCLCMAIFDGDKVIGFNYVKVGEGNIPLLRLRVVTGPTEAWSEQISVSKDYRRKGLANKLRQQFYSELKQRGITALYGHRQEFNVASRQSARKFTANILAKVNYIKFLQAHRLKLFSGNTVSMSSTAATTVKPNLKQSEKEKLRLSETIPPLFIVGIDKLKSI
jgi:ribosomal protein S18 acetylase RimI-like enzyme